MANLKATKDKALGKVQATTGKLLKDEEMEAKGKAKQLKGEAEAKVDEAKDKVLKKANDLIDEHK
ncbi:CsbD family protein [Lacticaseibacillus porcinae]|uniref:CsbD family protein n=1 Tax=Lacticaseibacillus porcinae TaxID=1123687 RepID=UPI000F76AC52|nr:CsbD family protein [Lacticaseibacillus porcinae]